MELLNNREIIKISALINIIICQTTKVQRLQMVDDRTPHESSWTPLLWAMKLITRARKEKKIEIEAPVFANLQSSFQTIETCNRKLLNYGWVNFPLAYTQVIIFI